MKRTASAGLAMVVGFTLVIAVACAFVIELDGPGLWGLGIGVGLGILNLGVGLRFTARALKRNMEYATRVLMIGFITRLGMVAVLVYAFQRTAAVDAVAFALSFMVFFFLYLAAEIILVERSLNGSGTPA